MLPIFFNIFPCFPIIIPLNKIDSVKKEDIAAAIVAYKDIYDFADIVPVSARSGNNTDELLEVVMKYLPYGPQFYDEEIHCHANPSLP